MRALLPRIALVIAALAIPGQPSLAGLPGPPSLAGLSGSPSLAGAPFQAGTPYIDGISDQSLPAWDGSFDTAPFAHYFRDAWAAPATAPDPAAAGVRPAAPEPSTPGPAAHIAFARYVVQWNVISGAYPSYLAQLEAWYRDVLDLGLAPDLSLASYDGSLPRSSAEYRAAVEALLGRFPATAYLEPWDEPNRAPGLTPATAAEDTLAAASLCRASGCTVIAGNLLDSLGMVAYERSLARALAPLSPPDWGIHPYRAVQTRDSATVLAFKAALPRAGAGARIWFTEIGAYRCEGGARPRTFGEAAQTRAAAWLVQRLMPLVQPVHVFYYELLYRDRLPPPCDRTDSDTALYVPRPAPPGLPAPPLRDAPPTRAVAASALAPSPGALAVAPRAAASYIQDDRGPLPSAASE